MTHSTILVRIRALPGKSLALTCEDEIVSMEDAVGVALAETDTERVAVAVLVAVTVEEVERDWYSDIVAVDEKVSLAVEDCVPDCVFVTDAVDEGVDKPVWDELGVAVVDAVAETVVVDDADDEVHCVAVLDVELVVLCEDVAVLEPVAGVGWSWYDGVAVALREFGLLITVVVEVGDAAETDAAFEELVDGLAVCDALTDVTRVALLMDDCVADAEYDPLAVTMLV